MFSLNGSIIYSGLASNVGSGEIAIINSSRMLIDRLN